MSAKRKLVRQYKPAVHAGFLGAGHLARPVIQGNFADTDPFILLMDDMLDKKTDEPVGGPHPHAGFETVTLMLEGEMGDEAHTMKGGDLQMMTAGSGVIHTETIAKKMSMRLLQLWLTLPKNYRWTKPRVQDISLNHVPKTLVQGAEIKLYSGSLAGIISPVQNYTPVIIADIKMKPKSSTVLNLPASYTTFLYMMEGSLKVGEEKKLLDNGQVGWLDRSKEEMESELNLDAGENGARFILYSGQPQGVQIVSHGPFIGDTQEDISRLYQEFRTGKMKHISSVPESQKLIW
ncbi:MAG TPA: pirin-like C-terminal cupin domain-containing protein [Puia sp.]|nr:pirin-like C-terminal cupin domain-containing protein [Puia sp.]